MRHRSLILSAAFLVAAGAGLAVVRAQQKPAAAPTQVMVYKTSTCGCCGLWVDHLRANGFQVQVEDLAPAKLRSLSNEAGVTPELSSCHTAKVGGYTVEGHVPAADIKRLLIERPAVAGITVPGMPTGSPGMEVGGRKDPYDVIAFTKGGKTSVFASHR
jgi:hypothetical protein